jgi:asparagine synthase (glutamine-hydrolysing)
MCGIAGLIDKHGKLAPDAQRAAVVRMTGAIAHRGPDDAGIWVSGDGGVALGHRRLSVIDVSAAGHQPMADETGQRALVFNGEIYNYRELRQGLERSGQTFRTRTDTEILLNLLGRQGIQTLPLLDGMYAFGHYDTASRSLLLARDPFGEKPLYYWDGPNYFLFASELSAILASGLFRGGIEAAELAAYLHFRYVPQPYSLYRDIRKLEPGCLLTYRDGRLEKKRHFAFQLPENLPLADPRQIADILEHELTVAVKSRLVSDVPLGAFLSSGVDSSLVCALATRKLGVPINTYTIAFDGGESEHEDAAAIARALGTTHHCHHVSHVDLLDVAARMGQILDEPNGDRSCVPTWLLSRFARQDITVALSGDGGDELFGGYGRYFGAQAALGDGLTPAQLAPQYFDRFLPVMPLEQLVKLFGGLPDRFQDIYASMLSAMTPARGTINTLRVLDANSYLPGAVLAKVDRMSMAHGLEVRVPILAASIARLAGRIPLSSHLADGKGKFLLRHILKKYLPAEWVDRRKTGFGMPPAFLKAHADFFGTQLAEAVHEGSALARVLDVKRLRALLPQATNNIIWAVIVLNQWLEKVFAADIAPEAGEPGEIRSLRGVHFGREDHGPTHGRDILDILAKPLPRRLDAPPPGIEGLIAAFDNAGVGPAPVNVFTYHTRVEADYRPIETFDVKGLDHRKFDYDYILAYFSHAAAGFFPGANVILVTDGDSPAPPGHRFSHVVRLDVNRDEPMYQRVRAMAAYVNSSAFTATTLFLDSDAFVGQDFRAALEADFDIAATFRPDPAMVLNEGVQVASHRRPEKVRAFYNGYLATYEKLAEDPDVQARYPHGIRKWRGGQLSLNSVAWDGAWPEAGEIRELDGTRVLYLPCSDYNHKPGLSDGLRDLLAKQVVHFKGNAKEFDYLRRYTLERNLPGWPLADLKLGLKTDAEPGSEAVVEAWGKLLERRHYAAAKNLCESLLAGDPHNGLALALIALVHFRVEGDWDRARARANQALAAGGLPEGVRNEIERLLKTTGEQA